MTCNEQKWTMAATIMEGSCERFPGSYCMDHNRLRGYYSVPSGSRVGGDYAFSLIIFFRARSPMRTSPDRQQVTQNGW